MKRLLVLALAAGLMGCPKPATSVDGGMLPIEVVKPPKPDAGMQPDPVPDAGLYFPPNAAGEPCPPEAFETDAGIPEGSVQFGLCVALRTLNLTALLNNAPAPGQIDLRFSSAQFYSEISRTADTFGKADIRVMKSRYEILSYHPSGVWQNHYGFEDFGVIDLNTDQQRTLAVSSFPIRGGAFFAGLPFLSVANPPDITMIGTGAPPLQQVSVSSQGGSYDLALLSGTSSIYLNVPPEALQGTELRKYPLNYALTIDKPTEFDISIPGTELQGDIRIDGYSLPDRRPGDDFQLEYTQSGETEPAVITHHEGGVDGFHSLVPTGKYAVNMTFESGPDAHLPAQLYNKQITQQVDLTQPATLSRNFITYPIEGGIVIDGVPPRPDPTYTWSLYMYGYDSATEPWFLTYYNVPLDSASFSLRAFPATYFAMIQMNDHLAPDLVDGWHRIERYFPVTGPATLPIIIDTALYTGKLLVDGEPPPEGAIAGDMIFRDAEGSYSRRISCSKDGEFRVRIPKGKYDVTFYIDRDTYPDYARGRFIVASGLDLTGPYNADLHYETKLVTGPIRVGGEPVADLVGGEDVKLHLRRYHDMTDWEWGFAGGSPTYNLHIPPGNYEMWFEIMQGAIDGVAWGQAPMGVRMPVYPTEITGPGTQ